MKEKYTILKHEYTAKNQPNPKISFKKLEKAGTIRIKTKSN